ncbi:ferritin-like domain-containing protein [Olivibacter sp. SDN3]|uniref:ferritin-like domain-containing protein n=1 Tax=Olivibacter sp. SDN3 TaxID=2764720 RepID=UPI0016515A59|nr:ferritin-like domain-containing protein [Olivibacter sp. SDN3]QNL48922.1 ferritin-like domain-containing protein [Olivibacter sp. SDN3]
MNVFKVIKDIENADLEIYERLNPRRMVIRTISSFGSKIALSSLPFVVSGLLRKAYGQELPQKIVDVLNFALTLEYLEAEFYTKALAANGLITNTTAKDAITVIRDHENQHVDFLKSALGAKAVAKPKFDFTASGTFSDVFSNYDTFLAIANALEDTGVRAYKGQAGELMENDNILRYALNIHSVEARHAAHIRQMRRARGGVAANLKPWITGSNDTGISAVDPIYANEDNKIQADIDITTLNGINGKISTGAATESFDEPLSKDAVLEIAQLFIVS